MIYFSLLMEKDLRKTGYALLAVGVFLILVAIIQITLVFTGILKPIGFFSLNASDFALDGRTLFPQLPRAMTSGMKVELFPAELINTSLNLGINTILVFLFMTAGGKIAGIGTQLLRPVYIKQKSEA